VGVSLREWVHKLKGDTAMRGSISSRPGDMEEGDLSSVLTGSQSGLVDKHNAVSDGILTV